MYISTPAIDPEVSSPIVSPLDGQTPESVVIKYGGAAMGNETEDQDLLREVIGLHDAGTRVALVHGGGNAVTGMAQRLGVQSEFVNGQRKTSAEMMEVALAVLTGSVNKQIVKNIRSLGGRAVGICGVDGGLFTCEKLHSGTDDLGFVGYVKRVDASLLTALWNGGFIPVIAPVGIGSDGNLYNINADVAAGAVAGSLSVNRLVFISDVDGIYSDGQKVDNASTKAVAGMIADGVITKGMIPKVQSACSAIDNGVTHVVLTNAQNFIVRQKNGGRMEGTYIHSIN